MSIENDDPFVVLSYGLSEEVVTDTVVAEGNLLDGGSLFFFLQINAADKELGTIRLTLDSQDARFCEIKAGFLLFEVDDEVLLLGAVGIIAEQTFHLAAFVISVVTQICFELEPLAYAAVHTVHEDDDLVPSREVNFGVPAGRERAPVAGQLSLQASFYGCNGAVISPSPVAARCLAE